MRGYTAAVSISYLKYRTDDQNDRRGIRFAAKPPLRPRLLLRAPVSIYPVQGGYERRTTAMLQLRLAAWAQYLPVALLDIRWNRRRVILNRRLKRTGEGRRPGPHPVIRVFPPLHNPTSHLDVTPIQSEYSTEQ
jgi:hypothetical protein